MVLCWVDAGLSVGLGPVSRGLALAEALAAYGLPCRMALSPDPTALAWLRLAGARPPVLLPDDEPALPRLLAAAARAVAVIVDLKRPLTSTEAQALGAGRRLLVVENGGSNVAAADLVLAPLARDAERDLRGLRPEGGRSVQWLVGPAYVPLRRVFRLAGDLRGARPSPPIVLVSMGACDPAGFTLPALEGVALARERVMSLAVRVVANRRAPVWQRLPGVLRRLDALPVSPLRPDDMVTELAAAELAVLSMGVTVYEAMACGVPAIVVGRSRGDLAHMRPLAAAGAIVSLGLQWTEERLATAIEELFASPARRATMGLAGRALVDGRGAERVAARLAAVMAQRTGTPAIPSAPECADEGL